MKMNGYSFTPRRILVRLAAAVLMLALFCAGGTVAYAETPTVHAPVSSVDISSSDILSGEPADFTRVVSVPVNINIPDFYQQVINVSGMYIFTMPDGQIHKRIYGAIDDVYGWYEPHGPDNIVFAGSEPIDTAADARMYYDALSRAELDAMERQDYAGILPPEEAVTVVEEVRGVTLSDLTYYFVGGAVTLCLIITVGALIVRSRSRTDEWYG
ncbi:MAG: hypothetical protein E7554_07615 [Ruminococcaceae bacterium]|nr:hypothetical protein [Oscillospiraceae bacterium]